MCSSLLKVYIRSNDTKFYRTYWSNTTASSSSSFELLVPDVDKDVMHFVEVAAHNKIGEGPRSQIVYVSKYDKCR